MNYVEITGVVTALLAVWLATRENVLNWPVAIISSGIYTIVFFNSKLYGDMILQVFYIVIGFYGWYMWLYGNENFEEKISRCKSKTLIYLFFSSLAAFFIALFFLKKTDSNVPYLDALTTVLSLAATWLLAKKFIENWFVWIVVDAISIGMYIYKVLYPTALLYFILTLLALYGHVQWKRTMKLQKV